jgi:hypothetical protein
LEGWLSSLPPGDKDYGKGRVFKKSLTPLDRWAIIELTVFIVKKGFLVVIEDLTSSKTIGLNSSPLRISGISIIKNMTHHRYDSESNQNIFSFVWQTPRVSQRR